MYYILILTLPLYNVKCRHNLFAIENQKKSIIIIFNYFWQPMGRVVWYCGVMGYILFFGFRFYISRKRRRVIIENDLINKLEEDSLNRGGYYPLPGDAGVLDQTKKRRKSL